MGRRFATLAQKIFQSQGCRICYFVTGFLHVSGLGQPIDTRRLPRRPMEGHLDQPRND
jgi:hypothetical protein